MKLIQNNINSICNEKTLKIVDRFRDIGFVLAILTIYTAHSVELDMDKCFFQVSTKICILI